MSSLYRWGEASYAADTISGVSVDTRRPRGGRTGDVGGCVEMRAYNQNQQVRLGKRRRRRTCCGFAQKGDNLAKVLDVLGALLGEQFGGTPCCRLGFEFVLGAE